jgi:hypothetical protein
MEWGADWLTPIQDRLSTIYSGLSAAELIEINAVCQTAMKFGHDTVCSLAWKSGLGTKFEDFEPIMKSQYPWVNAKNMSRLFSQGMYYAMK